MEAEAGKFIGAGLACLGMAGAGIGLGNLFGQFLAGALRNPSAADGQRATLLLGFALTEALGITIAHNTLPLDRPPIALHARTDDVEVATGIRIGITKAVELPWRYGIRGSKFLSKPFPK